MPESSSHTHKHKRSSDSAAAAIRARVERGSERFWSYADFDDLPPSAVASTLSRLAREGSLRRVRKGLYYRPRPTVLGESQPTASAVAAQALNAPVHPDRKSVV